MDEPLEVKAPLAAVSLKLPPFWPKDPIIWFAQIEAQFHTRNITSQSTKFAYVVSSLQPEIAQEVRDLLIDPPTVDQYDKIKSELIKRTSESEQKRLHQLLISEELGDRKPSKLLRRMKQLLGENKLETSILRQLFLQRLPQNVHLILASSSDGLDLDQLAIIADKIVEVASPSPAIAACTIAAGSDTPSQAFDAKFDKLQAQINQLTTLMQGLVTGSQESRNSRSRDRSGNNKYRSPSRQSRDVPRAGSECWYHWRFGDKATKCVKPCSYPDSNSNRLPHQEN
ncbi:uncharacterized protein [Asterias amurensis]|uniref:uncharacterized protein n=1 Tax=Asterias amurensis TaxID=7602 RepID=UPI003AB1747C